MDIKKEIKIKEYKWTIKKCEAVIEKLELDLLRNEEEMQRINSHMEQQRDAIQKAEIELENYKEE